MQKTTPKINGTLKYNPLSEILLSRCVPLQCIRSIDHCDPWKTHFISLGANLANLSCWSVGHFPPDRFHLDNFPRTRTISLWYVKHIHVQAHIHAHTHTYKHTSHTSILTTSVYIFKCVSMNDKNTMRRIIQLSKCQCYLKRLCKEFIYLPLRHY